MTILNDDANNDAPTNAAKHHDTRNHAIMQSCNHAIMQSCNHAIMQSYNHAIIQSYTSYQSGGRVGR
jgi:hypothetical protein